MNEENKVFDESEANDETALEAQNTPNERADAAETPDETGWEEEPEFTEDSAVLAEQDLLDSDGTVDLDELPADAAPAKHGGKLIVALCCCIGVLALAVVGLLGNVLLSRGGDSTVQWKGLVLGENYGKNVTLPDYSALTYTDTYEEPDDAAVVEEIHSKMTDHKTESETDEPIIDGDVVNIDFEGYINDVKHDNACSTGYDLTIGSGNFISGFEDGLIGHKAGEQVTLQLTFPDPYQNDPDLAGQPVRFEVTIHTVTRTVYDEITDALIAEITDGEYTTVDSYKGYLTATLQKERREEADSAARDELWDTIMDGAVLHSYPQEMYDYFVDLLDQQYASYYATYGVNDLAGFMQYNHLDLKEYVENQIKYEYAIYLIADEQGIEINDEDVQTLLDQYSYDSREALIDAMSMSDFELDEYILYQKTSAYLLTTATAK